MPTIRISEETKSALNDLGNTFDSVDDVLQRLIHEAGHEELLIENEPEDTAERSSNRSLDASGAKRKFRHLLKSHHRIQSVSKAQVSGNRDGLKLKTDEGTKHVWLKYSKFAGQENSSHAPFYGGTWAMTQKLSKDHPLFIAFLGQTEESYWIVPLDDFTSKFNITPDSKDGDQWKVNFEQGDNPNILDEYSTLDKLFQKDYLSS